MLRKFLFGQRKRRDTVLKRRTMEDVERQVEELREQNRQLRAAVIELKTAAREQQARRADSALGQQLLALSLEEPDSRRPYERMLRALCDAFQAGGAALWRLPETELRAEIIGVAGQVAAMLLDEPVTLSPEMTPSEIRRACEARLLAAAPSASSAHDPDHPLLLGLFLRQVDRPLGVIALCGANEGRFLSDDSSRLKALAPDITRAVLSIEQQAQLRRQLREMSLLLELSQALESITGADSLYRLVVDTLSRVISCENCTLFSFDAQRRQLIPRATRGRVVNLIDHIPFEQGSGISGWVAQQRKPLVIADLTRTPGLRNAEMIPPRVRSFVAVPMAAKENLVGVLNISDAQPNAFTENDVRLLTAIAGQAAVALERQQRVRALEQKMERNLPSF